MVTLTVNRAGPGLGVVTGNGIDCGVDCQETYPIGSQVTVMAVLLGEGVEMSRFAGWGGDCAQAGTSQTCTLTLQQSAVVTATFERVTAGVQVSRGQDPAPSGGTTLVARLSARAGCSTIRFVQFGQSGQPFRNARVGIAAPTGGPSAQTTGFLYTPPAGTTSVSFTIQRVVESGGATVSPIRLRDACGEWQTFVGGGPDAFR